MDWVLVAHVALWAFVIGLSVLVWLLSRQVGQLYDQLAPSAVDALSIGQAVPVPTVNDFEGGVHDLASGAHLLVFVAPDCPVCKQLLPKVAELTQSTETDLLLVGDGFDEDEHRRYIEAHGLSARRYALSSALVSGFGVRVLPYVVELNAGLVAAASQVDDASALVRMNDVFLSRGVS